MENIYSIFRDKLLLLGEHGYGPINHWIVNSISELYLVEAGYIALTSFTIIWSASTR
jgi:hypothetical protein